MKRPPITIPVLLVGLAACTVDNPNALGDGGTGPDDGANSTDTDSAESGTADADAGTDLPPGVGAVEVDGSSSPAVIESSRVVELRTTVDDDGAVARVEFYDGDALIGAGSNGAGNLWTLAWPVVGETFDGDHELTARATDDAEQQTTSPATAVTVDVPTSGTVEWMLPGTEVEHAGATVELFGPQHDGVFVGGSYESGDAPGTFARSADDGAARPWIDTLFTDSDVVDGSVRASAPSPDRLTMAAGGFTRDSNSDTEAFVAWYDTNGTELERWRPSNLTGAIAQDMAHADDGDLFVVLTAPSGKGRLQRFDPTRQPSGEVITEAAPFAVAVSSDAVWVLGRKSNGTPRLARYDHELVLVDSSETVFGSNDVTVDESLQRIYVAGNETGATGRVSAYDWNLAPLWSEPVAVSATSSEPRRLAVNPIHQVVVGSVVDDAIPLFDSIITFSSEGGTFSMLDLNATPGEMIREIQDLVVDPAGYVYATGYGLPAGGGPRPNVLLKLHP